MVESAVHIGNGKIELSASERMDMYEVALLATFPIIECPLKHEFTDGLYSRAIFMPAGSRVTSRKHLTNHQYAILQGKVTIVYPDTGEEVTLEAPFIGKTKAGTRRALYMHSDVIFATFHPVSIYPEDESEDALMRAVAKVEELILAPYDNELLKSIINENKLSASV